MASALPLWRRLKGVLSMIPNIASIALHTREQTPIPLVGAEHISCMVVYWARLSCRILKSLGITRWRPLICKEVVVKTYARTLVNKTSNILLTCKIRAYIRTPCNSVFVGINGRMRCSLHPLKTFQLPGNKGDSNQPHLFIIIFLQEMNFWNASMCVDSSRARCKVVDCESHLARLF